MNASVQTTRTSYMTAPEYFDDVSDVRYDADDEEDSDDESTRRDSYDSMMDFLKACATPSQYRDIPPYGTSSEDDDIADDDILSTTSESRASTPEWLGEPSIPHFMVPSLAYTPEHTYILPGPVSPTDSSTYTSSASSCSSPATSPLHPWSNISPSFSHLSSDRLGSLAFEKPSPPPFHSHRKSIAYPGEPGYDPHDHPEYILFGIQPDRRQKSIELTAPKPKRPVLETKVRELCEIWGKEEVVGVCGEWNRNNGETVQQQEKAFFNWWHEEERRAWEMFDVDAMYGLETYRQESNIWGSEGLPGGQYQTRVLCC